ncbi:MAG: hypothetical protein BA865_07920 [Desulfobacterales bacterium S5133MH4]|nr:MAG: hypothetical protein BA865_07920 [Desulfobacterales bacterium S5133MH4]
MIKYLVGWLMPMLLLFVVTTIGSTNELPALPGVVYDVLFKGDVEFEYKAGSLSPKEKALWLAVGTREKGRLGGPQKLWLWLLDAMGKKRLELDLQHLLNNKLNSKQYVDIENIVALEGGGVAVILVSETGSPTLARFDKTGSLISLRPLKKEVRDVLFSKIILASNDNLFLIGRLNGRAAVIKIDAAGDILWEKVVDDKAEEKISIFLDAVVSSDGELILLGHVVNSKGGHRLCIEMLNVQGKFQHKLAFDGERGAIAHAGDHGYIVALARKQEKTQSICLIGYSPSLKELWKTKMFEEENFSAAHIPVKAAATIGGDSLVVMSKKSRPWIVQVKDGGKVLWRHMLQNDSLFSEIVWNFDLLQSASEFTIPITMLNVDPKVMEQRQEMRVIKFVLK